MLHKSTTFNIMGLPAEVRVEILRHCVVVPNGGLIHLRHGRSQESGGFRHTLKDCQWQAIASHSLQLGILQTCHKLHKEASYVFYAFNIFTTDMEAEDSSRDRALAERNSACAAVPKVVECLRRKIGPEESIRKLAFDNRSLPPSDVLWFLKHVIRDDNVGWPHISSIVLRNFRQTKVLYVCQLDKVPHTPGSSHHCSRRRPSRQQLETQRSFLNGIERIGRQLEREELCARWELRTGSGTENPVGGGDYLLLSLEGLEKIHGKRPLTDL
jgi:hypothetical protein